ncbi:hypothetical protein HMN09_01283300 [Mycena chlorophos]|uniref:Uncharacterized protein n=1 Tax=Mycena chlorophos TaxID=658473 RepID=A0A8H6S497_MYCCL|nr:hypothetical protein HMN09_01283300 [Mycena chlorophos]
MIPLAAMAVIADATVQVGKFVFHRVDKHYTVQAGNFRLQVKDKNEELSEKGDTIPDSTAKLELLMSFRRAKQLFDEAYFNFDSLPTSHKVTYLFRRRKALKELAEAMKTVIDVGTQTSSVLADVKLCLSSHPQDVDSKMRVCLRCAIKKLRDSNMVKDGSATSETTTRNRGKQVRLKSASTDDLPDTATLQPGITAADRSMNLLPITNQTIFNGPVHYVNVYPHYPPDPYQAGPSNTQDQSAGPSGRLSARPAARSNPAFRFSAAATETTESPQPGDGGDASWLSMEDKSLSTLTQPH